MIGVSMQLSLSSTTTELKCRFEGNEKVTKIKTVRVDINN